MMHLPDRYLQDMDMLAGLQEGQEKALARLFNQYHSSLVWFSFKFTKDVHIAEDIVAESFVTYWKRRVNFSNLYNIRAFLYVTVKNGSLNYLKQDKRRALHHREIAYLAEHTELPDKTHPMADVLQQLLRDIEELPAQRRRIFKMIFLEGFSIFETATALNISVDTVRVQKARALNALRINLLLNTSGPDKKK